MKRGFWIIFFVCLCVETYSVRPLRKRATPKAPHVLTGAIHVHSLYSDGSGTPQEIVTAAREASLDFVVLTDHNNSRARLDGFEKSYEGVDLFIEMEASTPAGHALSFFSHTNAASLSDPRVTDLTYEHLIGQGSPEGFFIVSAHPSNIKNPWTQLDRYPDGVEIANFDSFWQQQLYDSLPGFMATLFSFCFNEHLGALRFIHFNAKDLQAWDAMNAIQPGHFGILGHDVHAKLKLNQDLVFRWPDYRPTFNVASNAVFLHSPPSSEFAKRKRQIYEAIRQGRSAIVFQLLHPFSVNEWKLVCGEKTYISGDKVDYAPQCHFQVVTPHDFPVHLILVQDGKPVFEKISSEGVLRIPVTGHGVYRLEVHAAIKSSFRILLPQNVPYIFYNPIYIR